MTTFKKVEYSSKRNDTLSYITAQNLNDIQDELIRIGNEYIGNDGGVGVPGKDGKSAYEVWLDAGNKGTVVDFLLSLKGAKGEKGDTGIQGEKGPKGDKGDMGPQGPVGPEGPAGSSSINDSSIETSSTWSSAKINTQIEQNINSINNELSNVNKQYLEVVSNINVINQKVKNLTPELFGAKGDGVNDDLQAFKDMFNFMNTNARPVNIGGSDTLKDFGPYNIMFNGEYAISNTIFLPSCYNLNLTGLYLTATSNFTGVALMKSEGIFRNSIFSKCIFDGNWWKASGILIESSSLNNRFTDCQFRRFKDFGLKAGDNKGHELLLINCKINQYEWGDENEGKMPPTEGVGLYIAENRHDNQITNCVFNYCQGSAIKIYGSSNFIDNTHVYSRSTESIYAVELMGTYSYFNHCFFDYTNILMNGFNYIKNSFFMGETGPFIVLNESAENKWKYETSAITGNTFKSNSSTKIKEVIKATNFQLTNNCINMYDNIFNNCEPISCYTNSVFNPSPFKMFEEDLSSNGYQIIGNIKYIWGYASCGSQITLDCSRILNVQVSPASDGMSNTYVSGVISNSFVPKGTGDVFYFAVCVI